VPSLQSTYWVQVGAFVSEQTAILFDALRLRPHVLVLASYRASDHLRLLYGAGYTYAAGRGLPLPFLGAAWRFAPAWRLDVLLPVQVRVTWTATDRVSVSGLTRLAGDLFRYRAHGPSGQVELQDLRIARLRLGVAGQYALSKRTFLELETGAEGASIDTGLSRRSAVGAYVGASLGYGSAGYLRGLR
jgi:hypothetical protein